uniref:Beta-2-microglobulin n=2 Tax=Anguilla anguilla TaxID=7936 RepID=A0A0E9XKI7_ANGAN
MNSILTSFCLAVLLVGVNSIHSAPKVQVYSKLPGQFDQPNVLLCYVSNFHPPDIKITLLKDNVEMPGATQTDLAFEQSWQFHLTKSVPFTPQAGEKYACRVQHQGITKPYSWEPDM